MMSEFDDRDPELAEALNAALSVNDDDAFLRLVMRRADQGGLFDAPQWWDVLNMWARPGLAVAAVVGILLAVATLSTDRPHPLTTIAEGLSSAGAAAEMAESAPPNPESMMAVAFAIE